MSGFVPLLPGYCNLNGKSQTVYFYAVYTCIISLIATVRKRVFRIQNPYRLYVGDYKNITWVCDRKFRPEGHCLASRDFVE